MVQVGHPGHQGQVGERDLQEAQAVMARLARLVHPVVQEHLVLQAVDLNMPVFGFMKRRGIKCGIIKIKL
jgi:hypothetical protein